MPTMHMQEIYRGSDQILVFNDKRNKEPHFVITGCRIGALDPKKVKDYLDNCDWTDRGSRGWITPQLRCDGFLKTATSV